MSIRSQNDIDTGPGSADLTDDEPVSHIVESLHWDMTVTDSLEEMISV